MQPWLRFGGESVGAQWDMFGVLSEGEVWEGLRRDRTNIQKIFQYVSRAKTHVQVVPNLRTLIANLWTSIKSQTETHILEMYCKLSLYANCKQIELCKAGFSGYSFVGGQGGRTFKGSYILWKRKKKSFAISKKHFGIGDFHLLKCGGGNHEVSSSVISLHNLSASLCDGPFLRAPCKGFDL